jgi:hypothetical protein
MGWRWTNGGDGILVGRFVDYNMVSSERGGDVGSMEFGGDEFGNLEKCLIIGDSVLPARYFAVL